jgi:uncharacterized membrane protein
MNKNSIKNSIISIILLIVLYIVCDIPYLYLTNGIFNRVVNRIQGNNNGFASWRLYSALLVYICLAIGVYNYVLPLIKSGLGSTKNMIITSAIFGIVCYGVFDFTIHIMFRDYPLWVAIMDTLWGGVLTAIVVGLYLVIYNKVIST